MAKVLSPNEILVNLKETSEEGIQMHKNKYYANVRQSTCCGIPKSSALQFPYQHNGDND